VKTYWGSGGIAPPFLTSALDGGERSASRFRPLSLWGTTPSRYPFVRRISGLQNRSGSSGAEKNLFPYGIRTPTLQLVALRYIDFAIPTLIRNRNNINITLIECNVMYV
jgi:hypothetical protein